MRISDWSSDVRSSDLLARRVFDEFRAPMLRLNISPEDGWHIASIRPMALSDLKPEQAEFFELALETYTRSSWRTPKAKPAATSSLGLLHNPADALPPTDNRPLQKLTRIGEPLRSEARRVGEESVRTFRSRWWPYP